MPNKIAADKKKVVYNDYTDTLEELHLIAKRRRCTLSDIVREATQDFVEKHEDVVNKQKKIDAMKSKKK